MRRRSRVSDNKPHALIVARWRDPECTCGFTGSKPEVLDHVASETRGDN